MKYCLAIGTTVNPKAPTLLGGDFCESMRQAKAMGYDAVEIHTGCPQDLDVGRLLDVCSQEQMTIETLGTGKMYVADGLSMIEEDPQRLQQTMQRLYAFVDIAAQLHSRVTIGCVRGNLPAAPSQPYAYYEGLLGKTMGELDAYAQQKGVILLLEAINRFENNYLNTAKQVADFIEKYQLRSTKILIDVFHMNIEEESLQECFESGRQLIGYIHFADNSRRYLGSGRMDLQEIKDWITAIGYDGVLSLECLPVPDGAMAARRSIAVLRKLFPKPAL